MTHGVSIDADAWLRRAVGLSATALPHPNPRVGALVLDASGQEIASAVHLAAGEPHAEAAALDIAGDAARNGTLVVTLEPCDHHGRTPPCTEAIIASGVSTVVVGALDPDSRVQGRGVDRLRAAGVDVVGPVAPALVENSDPAYFHHRRTGQPLVTLKWAMTVDGQVAAADGSSRWISGDAARADAHLLRSESDVVMVGAGTVRADDPRLDVRLPDHAGHQPRPVIVAGAEPLPQDAAIWSREPLVYAPEDIAIPSGELVVAPGGRGVDLTSVVKDLAGRGVLGILVEGGPALAAALWDAGLVDRFVVYVGARLGGGIGVPPLRGSFPTMNDATDAEVVSVEMIGPDVKIVGTV